MMNNGIIYRNKLCESWEHFLLHKSVVERCNQRYSRDSQSSICVCVSMSVSCCKKYTLYNKIGVTHLANGSQCMCSCNVVTVDCVECGMFVNFHVTSVNVWWLFLLLLLLHSISLV